MARLMSKKILVVYNTCGISGKENSDYYVRFIQSIIDQDFDSFDIVVSSCLNSEETRNKLLNKFSGKVKFNFVDERHPVNVTFNHSVMKSIKYWPPR